MALRNANMFICGIQQLGLGVHDMKAATDFYQQLGFDIVIFETQSVAENMKAYMGGNPHLRHAKYLMNLQGGGGLELWQYLDRTPTPLNIPICIGDIGINAAVFKCVNPYVTRQKLKASHPDWIISDIKILPSGEPAFWLQDPFGNYIQITTGELFLKNNDDLGGVGGVVIGVKKMESALAYYQQILGIQEVVYDITEQGQLFNTKERLVRRVLLKRPVTKSGAFSEFLGSMRIELVESLSEEPQDLYLNRFWGDLGYIHLCLDVNDMEKYRLHIQQYEHRFTVDSQNNFDMEGGAGRFAYLESPDHTLIELVQTNELTLFPYVKWNILKRNHKPLPRWFFHLLSLKRFFTNIFASKKTV